MGRALLAAIFLFSAAPALADCADRITLVEQAMQDGLSDLAAARNLLDEGQSELKRDPYGPGCHFLRNGAEALSRAHTHFARCAADVDAILEACTDPDWTALSASPALCAARVAEIEATRASVPDTSACSTH